MEMVKKILKTIGRSQKVNKQEDMAVSLGNPY